MALELQKRLGTWKGRERPGALLLVGAAAVLTVVLAILLAGGRSGLAAGILALVGMMVLAFRSPFWALVVVVAQYAVIPVNGWMFGQFVPNLLQFLAPLLFLAAVLQSLRDAAHERLAGRLADFFVAGFALWGLVGLFLAESGEGWKYYGNKIAFPMLLYFVVRLVPMDHRRVRQLLVTVMIVVALQSVLLVRESMVGSSPIYGGGLRKMQGVHPASGPFRMHYGASMYMCLWPALFAYAAASARRRGEKVAWAGGLLVVLAATTRTMERAGIAAGLLGIGVGLLAPRYRRQLLGVVALLAVLYLPWSWSDPGSGLLERFRDTDESRYAYRTDAVNLLKSDDWHPIWGIGFMNYIAYAGRHGTDEEVLAWGRRRGTVASIAEGSALHNVWLALLLEFGTVGTLLAAGMVLCLGWALVQMRRMAAQSGKVLDQGMLLGILGALTAWAAVSYYQNTYLADPTMSTVWVFYGLLVGHPQAFVTDQGAEEEAVAEAGESTGPA